MVKWMTVWFQLMLTPRRRRLWCRSWRFWLTWGTTSTLSTSWGRALSEVRGGLKCRSRPTMSLNYGRTIEMQMCFCDAQCVRTGFSALMRWTVNTRELSKTSCCSLTTDSLYWFWHRNVMHNHLLQIYRTIDLCIDQENAFMTVVTWTKSVNPPQIFLLLPRHSNDSIKLTGVQILQYIPTDGHWYPRQHCKHPIMIINGYIESLIRIIFHLAGTHTSLRFLFVKPSS